MINLIICVLHRITGDRIKNFELSGACSLYELNWKYRLFVLYLVVIRRVILKSVVGK